MRYEPGMTIFFDVFSKAAIVISEESTIHYPAYTSIAGPVFWGR